MLELWTWATRSCPDGELAGMTAWEVEGAAGYASCDGRLCKAMIDAGFIDATPEGEPLRIHNWMERTGGAITKMEDQANRKRMFRLHKAGNCDRSTCQWCKSDGHPGDVQEMSTDSPRTVHRTSDTDQTRPVKTSPDKTRQDQIILSPHLPPVGGGEFSLSPPEPARPAKPKRGTETPGFLRFWQAYPRKQAKPDAIQAWERGGCEPIADEIVDALERQIPTWDDPKFVKLPAGWIRQQRWKDEPTSVVKRQQNTAFGHFRATTDGPVISGRIELP